LDQALLREAVDDFDRFEMFFTSRWRELIWAGLAVVVAVGVGTWGISAHRLHRARAASELGAAKTPEQIREVLARHGGHPAAAYARLRLVKLLADQGQAESALSEAQALLASAPAAPEVVWQTRLNIGYLQETLGRDEDAAETFAAIGLDLTLPEFIRAEANVNAARIFLRRQQNDRAKGCLQAINLDSDAGYLWLEKARALLRRLP